MADRPEQLLARFIAKLTDLRSRAGDPSLKLLDQMTARAGHRLARSTLHQKLRGESPPDWPFVEAFVRACLAHADHHKRCVLDEDRNLTAWRTAHQELLRGLAAARSTTRLARAAKVQLDERPSVVVARQVPRQLPPNVHCFVGRVNEVHELDELLDRTGRTTVPIAVVCGMAGVGKTALMLHWAHRVVDRFPDGQLYVDLRGFDLSQPLAPGEALAAMLRALGVPGTDIPYELTERAAYFRTIVAGRRLLVLLDNARDVDQVRHLLPGSTSCLVVLTSRNRLGALVAQAGAHRLELDSLPVESCVRFFERLLGDRADRDRQVVEALARRCGQLPLALRVVAELANDRPGVTVAALLDELTDEGRRLDLLDAGEDPRTAVREVFSWSYRQLSTPVARALRLLGIHPGHDIDLAAMAALIDARPAQAQRIIDLLARGHLTEPRPAGRYGMHDLLRAYAAEMARGEDGEEEIRAAQTRVLRHYLDLASSAADAAAHGRTLLDSELRNLVAAAVFAAGHGWLHEVVALSHALADHLYIGAHYDDALVIHGHALDAARRLDDRLGEAHAHRHLSAIFRRWGRYEQALDHGEQALADYRLVGDHLGEANALKSLGLVHQRQGRYELAAERHREAHALAERLGDRLTASNALGNLAIVYDLSGRYEEAFEHYQRALSVFRELGNRSGEGKTLGNLGIVYGRWGQTEQALACHRESLMIAQEVGDRAGEGDSLDNLGTTYRRAGEYREALHHLEQALTVRHEIGDRAGEGKTIDGLGIVYALLGDWKGARQRYRQALAIARELGDRHLEARALNGLAETSRRQLRVEEAVSQQTSALAIAREVGDRYQEARANDGLGHCLMASGDIVGARRYWIDALSGYNGLTMSEAEDVRQRIVRLDRGEVDLPA